MSKVVALQTPNEIALNGGRLIEVNVDEPFVEADLCRLVVTRYSLSEQAYIDVADCYSGTPGTPIARDDDYLVRTIYPKRYEDSPWDLRIVRGYSPRLRDGLYYLDLRRWDGEAWVSVGNKVAIRALPPCRYTEIYNLRRNFPTPPHYTGPKSMDVEPLSE
jgi:hypothetical protein